MGSFYANSRTLRRAVGLVLLSLLGGCALEARGTEAGFDSAPIIHGVNEPGYDSVVFLSMGPLGTCTGSYISPHVVLTAKHCVMPVGQPIIAPSQVTIIQGPTGSSSLRYVGKVKEIRASSSPRSQYTDQGLRDEDIALLLLNDTLGSLVPYGWVSSDPGNLIGRTVTAVGYGQSVVGSPGTGGYAASGTKRRGTATIIEPPPPSPQSQQGTKEFTVSGGVVCFSDSGGPAFLGDRVFGVVSRGLPTSAYESPDCSGPAAYTRTDAFRAAIEDAIVSTGDVLPSSKGQVGGAGTTGGSGGSSTDGTSPGGDVNGAPGSPQVMPASPLNATLNGGCSVAGPSPDSWVLSALVLMCVGVLASRGRRRARA